MTGDEESYRKAKEKVAELKGFYSHLFAYIFVNLILAIINYLTSPGYYWFWWVTLFWGIGLLMHAWHVFGHPKVMGDDWEERKIKEYMEKDKK
ncbi:MAG: 2TM domain-containing protein [Methanomicrobiaceae archaeon]|nr:2TM domain-containing protein [Methanomicrobiaceae archaeon]